MQCSARADRSYNQSVPGKPRDSSARVVVTRDFPETRYQNSQRKVRALQRRQRQGYLDLCLLDKRSIDHPGGVSALFVFGSITERTSEL